MNMQSHPQVNLPDITALSARLAHILALEADMLKDMKVSEIEPLQKEKQLLTSALEAQKKLLERNPDILKGASAEEKSKFKKVVAAFNHVLKENHRRLRMAKEVNRKVVEAIAEVANADATRHVYNGNGMSEHIKPGMLSLTLNKVI